MELRSLATRKQNGRGIFKIQRAMYMLLRASITELDIRFASKCGKTDSMASGYVASTQKASIRLDPHRVL